MATDLEQLERASSIPIDIALVKMENDSMMAAAVARPRDPSDIVRRLKELIEAYPAAAGEAIYKKPVGTVTRVTCGNKNCGIFYDVNKITNDTACPACKSSKVASKRRVKKFAEGLSIRAAESIRSIYGYSRLATTQSEIMDDGTVKISGTMVDYAAGTVTSDERIVSRRYKAASGEIVETPEDRFLNVVVKAEKAKLRRDVILDSIPGIVKASFLDACENKLKQLISPEQIDQKVLPAFAEFGISVEQVEEIIGRPRKLGWREQDRIVLRKVLVGLQNGETAIGELLDTKSDSNWSDSSMVKRYQDEPVTKADVTTLEESLAEARTVEAVGAVVQKYTKLAETKLRGIQYAGRIEEIQMKSQDRADQIKLGGELFEKGNADAATL
jgi:predicted Zn-ribbon and HTH transcriptional regulator